MLFIEMYILKKPLHFVIDKNKIYKKEICY